MSYSIVYIFSCLLFFKYCRDWRGLAHLVGLKFEEIPVLAFDTDPTSRILHLWQKQSTSLCTIKQLQTFLEELDRYDIVNDTAEMIGQYLFYFNVSFCVFLLNNCGRFLIPFYLDYKTH